MTGFRPVEGAAEVALYEAVGAAIAQAKRDGLDLSAAAIVVAVLAADCWRGEYGNGALGSLAGVVTARAHAPLPPAADLEP